MLPILIRPVVRLPLAGTDNTVFVQITALKLPVDPGLFCVDLFSCCPPKLAQVPDAVLNEFHSRGSASSGVVVSQFSKPELFTWGF